MAYILPQVEVFQQFRNVSVEVTNPLRAMIAGPHAFLVRYSTAAEKLLGLLGAYDVANETAYSWPNRPAGGIVDLTYTRLFTEDAEFEYFADLIGDGDTVTPPDVDYPNRIQAQDASGSFKANGSSRPRYAGLYDRDVQPGDRVHLHAVVGGDDFYLDTYVQSVASTDGDRVEDTVTTPPDADAGNIPDQGALVVVTAADGNTNNSGLFGNASAYSRLADGFVDDVYTVTVITGETSNDPTTARLRITSASGLDDDASVAPAADTVAFPIGAFGLELTIVKNGSPQPLVAGQVWTLAVTGPYDAPAVTADGTYVGATDTTYIVRFTRGGLFADTDATKRPAFTVTTTTGVDVSGPTTVNSAGTAYPVGTQGVTFTVTNTGVLGIRKGDIWYIPVTAAANGYFRTLILAHNLGSDMLTATDIDLRLAIRRNIEIPALQPATIVPNYTTTSSNITVAAGVLVTLADFTDGGVPRPLPLTTGTLYAHYRAWLPDLATELNTIVDIGDLDSLISGDLTPDNPLKWGVYKTLANANGTAVRFAAVADPSDLDDWAAMLDLLTERTDIYNIVPLSNSREVHNLVAAHCTERSSPSANRWRATFVPLLYNPIHPVIGPTTSSDSNVVLATVADDPTASGTQYTLFTDTSENGKFITNGVAAGDTVRYGYTLDQGNEVWTSYTVDRVLTETTLLVLTGPGAAVTVPQRLEIWHTNSKNELAADIATQAASFGSTRVCAVWPDTFGSAGTQEAGYFLCCMLAGLRSGVAPHQGLTNVALQGADDLSRTTKFFSTAQLNTMAASGVWIVTQSPTGEVYSRHALTTGDQSNLNTREEMIRVNADSISYLHYNRLAPFIGKANAAPSVVEQIRMIVVSTCEFLKSAGVTDLLGPQLIDAPVIDVRLHPTLKDRVQVNVTNTLPYALNNIDVYLTF